MAVDVTKVRPDLIGVSVGGAEHLMAKVSYTVGGVKIPIMSANFGEAVGYMQGDRNLDIDIEYLETEATIARARLGFDGAGTDNAPAVGTICTPEEVRLWDPLDTAKLAQIIAYAAVLQSATVTREGRGQPASLVCKYKTQRNSAGNVWGIGAGT